MVVAFLSAVVTLGCVAFFLVINLNFYFNKVVICKRLLIMTQTSETVTYSLESVLTRIESKIDNLQRDVNQKFDSLQRDVDQKIDNLQKDVNQKFDSLQREWIRKSTFSKEIWIKQFDSLQKDVNQKFDSLQKDVNGLKVEVTEIKGDIKTLDQKVETMDKRLEKVEDNYAILVKDIADLKGVKSLIIPMIVAFLSAVVTLGSRLYSWQQTLNISENIVIIKFIFYSTNKIYEFLY